MKKILSALVVAAAVAAAPAAEAQVSFDLKAGYAVPTGDVFQATQGAMFSGKMSNLISGSIPLEIAARYRFTPNLSAGIYFQYDPAFVSSTLCTSGMSCSAYDMRLGAEVMYGFMPANTLNPWVSVGTGWEWLGATVKVPGVGDFSGTLNGWEWFNVQVGLDWNLTKAWAVGPYVGFFGGEYTTLTMTGPLPGLDGSQTIPSSARSFHGWWQFGLKGTFNL